MRPISRGDRPIDGDGNAILFSAYPDARSHLIARLGEYCSYCEMHLDASLAVEHVKPKKPPGALAVDNVRALEWTNFLLACQNCNSTKGNTDVDIADYLWPDRDNTFSAIAYSDGGIVSIRSGIDPAVAVKASATIDLVGLDKTPDNDPSVSDRRWINRRDAWGIAVRSRGNLAKRDSDEMRDQISLTALAGFWSVWMTVFSDDPDMLSRLIAGHPGTDALCFELGTCACVPRLGGVI